VYGAGSVATRNGKGDGGTLEIVGFLLPERGQNQMMQEHH
jgi:hypothetical protein